MKIGWNGTGVVGKASIEVVRSDAQTAKEAGYTSYWLADHPTGGFDALTALAVAGAQVPDIEFGTAVIPIMPRNPMALAAQALTVNQALGGRFTLGIGLSHATMMADLGLPFDKPIRYLREYLSILMPLLNEGKVDFTGELLSGKGQLFQQPPQTCDVVVAALGPQALRVAGRLARGTILAWVGPNTIRDHIVPTISEAAAEHGREAPRVIATLPVCVTTDEAPVRQMIDQSLGMYAQLPSYQAMFAREGVAGPGEMALVGSASFLEEQVERLRTAGVTDFTPTVFAPSAAQREATHEFLGRLLAR